MTSRSANNIPNLQRQEACIPFGICPSIALFCIGCDDCCNSNNCMGCDLMGPACSNICTCGMYATWRAYTCNCCGDDDNVIEIPEQQKMTELHN